MQMAWSFDWAWNWGPCSGAWKYNSLLDDGIVGPPWIWIGDGGKRVGCGESVLF